MRSLPCTTLVAFQTAPQPLFRPALSYVRYVNHLRVLTSAFCLDSDVGSSFARTSSMTASLREQRNTGRPRRRSVWSIRPAVVIETDWSYSRSSGVGRWISYLRRAVGKVLFQVLVPPNSSWLKKVLVAGGSQAGDSLAACPRVGRPLETIITVGQIVRCEALFSVGLRCLVLEHYNRKDLARRIPCLLWLVGFIAGRRDGRAVEGARLESVCRGNSTEGSNPSLSATTFFRF